MSSMRGGAPRIRVFLLLLLYTFCAAEFQIKNDRRIGMEFNHSANLPVGDDGVLKGALKVVVRAPLAGAHASGGWNNQACLTSVVRNRKTSKQCLYFRFTVNKGGQELPEEFSSYSEKTAYSCAKQFHAQLFPNCIVPPSTFLMIPHERTANKKGFALICLACLQKLTESLKWCIQTMAGVGFREVINSSCSPHAK